MCHSFQPSRVLPIVVILLLVAASDLHAVCMNKYIFRTDGNRQVITLLTGKLTFQEAQALAHDISGKKAPPLEWVDEKGKTIARQFGDLKIVRPMPVSCEDKASGVVMTTTFLSMMAPAGHISVKLPSGVVIFDEQKQ
jgi:hypothetical protein